MERELISVEDIIISAQNSINDFPINGKFLITDIIEKTTKNGDPYYNIKLKDKTGNLKAKRFTNGDSEFKSLNTIYLIGNIIEIEGIYQNEWDSLKINTEKLIESDDCESFVVDESSDIDIDNLTFTLNEIINSIQNKYLKNLLVLIFRDNDIRQACFDCPSSVGMHHSYKHGNLKHIVSMLKTFQTLEENYRHGYDLDRDLIYTGIIIHDIGKTKEYLIKNGIPLRNPGYGLIGHFSLGIEIVAQYIKQIENFPEDLERKLVHLILSHHGRKEYGSPIEPQTPEAEILHLLDNLDARFANTLR